VAMMFSFLESMRRQSKNAVGYCSGLKKSLFFED
jgi:hypothetical protein